MCKYIIVPLVPVYICIELSIIKKLLLKRDGRLSYRAYHIHSILIDELKSTDTLEVNKNNSGNSNNSNSKILKENKDKLNQLADILIEKEVIFKDDLETIFGKRTFDDNLAAIVS